MSEKTNKKKRKTPEKICPSCNSKNHARASSCKSCTHVFYEKKGAKQRRWAENWKALESGDVIKCISGHGTYWKDSNTGEKIYMGLKGTFEVIDIYNKNDRSCGIVGKKVLRGGRRGNIREFIYMGESYYNEDTGLYNSPHKIIVIKKKNP